MFVQVLTASNINLRMRIRIDLEMSSLIFLSDYSIIVCIIYLHASELSVDSSYIFSKTIAKSYRLTFRNESFLDFLGRLYACLPHNIHEK